MNEQLLDLFWMIVRWSLIGLVIYSYWLALNGAGGVCPDFVGGC
jgi:hypothetical protein